MPIFLVTPSTFTRLMTLILEYDYQTQAFSITVIIQYPLSFKILLQSRVRSRLYGRVGNIKGLGGAEGTTKLLIKEAPPPPEKELIGSPDSGISSRRRKTNPQS